jgi:hypothetical protein
MKLHSRITACETENKQTKTKIAGNFIAKNYRLGDCDQRQQTRLNFSAIVHKTFNEIKIDINPRLLLAGLINCKTINKSLLMSWKSH